MASRDPKRLADKHAAELLAALQPYQAAHPKAKVDVSFREILAYYCIRIRIIDPDFNGKNHVDRESEIWKLLRTAPEEALQDLTMLLLLTPKEAKSSIANLDFEKPLDKVLV